MTSPTGGPGLSGVTPAPERAGASSLLWLDLIKGAAIVWIFFNHLGERIFGYPHIANPNATWVPLAVRIDQLRPLAGHGLWDIPVNLLRYVGWFGDQGVQLFIIASGFGLTWGLLQRGEPARLNLGRFYGARLWRVYPLWWGAHLAFLALSLVAGSGLLPDDLRFYLSLIGFRATPDLIYYFAPAWWYVGLLIQLYLVYPLLWYGLRRHGPAWLLLVSCVVGFTLRGVGLEMLSEWLDAWSRGSIFITRLPEFVLGISLAAWWQRAPARTASVLRAPATVFAAVACYGIATLLSLTLAGMTVAPFLLGAAVLVMLYAVLCRWTGESAAARAAVWAGRHSYALYLVHHPMIALLVPKGGGAAWLVAAGGLVAAAATILGAVMLERVVEATVRLARGESTPSPQLLRVAVAATALAALLMGGAEMAIRRWDPQEVFGWGERPSLEPHPEFGWRLKPSHETHLRWESYDYHVQANSLGFPGPEYAIERTPGTLRILTVGDAFTSAEGVDTGQAWPRQLEGVLRARMSGVEVLNFGITGYGPNQYAAVIRQFAPTYRPDLMVIGFFVNEYEDVLWSNSGFQDSIGFDRPPPDSWLAALTLPHLRKWLKLQIAEPLLERALGRPRAHGYFLGQFGPLERDNPNIQVKGRAQVAARLREIGEVARGIGARVVIAMIPAPVQVCGRADLAYYPRTVDLKDGRFDRELPQRMTREIAAESGFAVIDLQPVLAAAPTGCPYQPSNLHWTAAGHQLVADYLAQTLLSERHGGAATADGPGPPASTGG